MKNKIILSVLTVLMAVSVFFSATGAQYYGVSMSTNSSTACKAGIVKNFITKAKITMTKEAYSNSCYWYTYAIPDNGMFYARARVSNPKHQWNRYFYTLNGIKYYLWGGTSAWY